MIVTCILFGNSVSDKQFCWVACLGLQFQMPLRDLKFAELVFLESFVSFHLIHS